MTQCSYCSQVSNNKFFACPPLMEDGRLFTDYRPRCDAFATLPQQDSNTQRQYLIRNAVALMDSDRKQAKEKTDCGPCKQPYAQGTLPPPKEMVSCNSTNCLTNLVNADGIGRIINYQAQSLSDTDDTTDAYKAFLSVKQREQDEKFAAENAKHECCNCSKLFDPLYFSLETFDELGKKRPAYPSGALL